MWKKVLDVIRVSVSSANFTTWFSQTFIAGLEEKSNGGQLSIIQIGCPSSFVQTTLEKRYGGLLEDAINQVTGQKNNVVFTVRQNTKKPQVSSPLFMQSAPETSGLLKKAQILKGYSFDNFAVSPSNQLAWSAAVAVTKNPSKAYNPLFVWGGVGGGKTHLALATAREIVNRFPEKKVLFSTGDEFIVGIIDSIRSKTTNEFKKKYRSVDVLVVDDIAFIAGKDTVQNEFFHTFNEIQRAGGQVILTSDRPPYEIDRLEPRLQSRFQAGLIVDIGPPDFELRVAILIIKAEQKGIELSIELAQKIAEIIPSARQIEGFLARLSSKIDHQNLPMSSFLVEELLKSEVQTQMSGFAKRSVNPKEIVNSVCDYFSITKKSLIGASRKKTLVVPRHILMFLLRTELNLPYGEIGRILGGRDHTTVIHGVEKMGQEIASSEYLQGNILGIKNKLWG